MNDNDIDVVLIQEPYIFNKKAVGLFNVWTVILSLDERAGICICNKNLNVVLNVINNSSVFVNCIFKDFCVNFCSVYAAPTGNINDDLADVGNHIPLCVNYIIGGDFNGKNRIWGYDRADARGDVIVDFINVYNLCLLNDTTQPPTFYQPGRIGYPDLSFCNAEILDKIKNWQVWDGIDSLSDHRYVTYDLCSEIVFKRIERFYTKYGKIGKLRSLIKNNFKSLIYDFNNVTNLNDINKYIDFLNTSLFDYCKCCFRMKNYIISNNLCWWNEDLRSFRNKTRALLIKYNRTGNIRYKIMHSKQRALYKLKIKNAKEQAWKNFCSKTCDSFGTVFNVIKENDVTPISNVTVRLDGMCLSSTSAEINNELLKFHFNYVNNIVNECVILSLFPEITCNEVNNALSALNADKAPGYDNVDLRVWRIVASVLPDLLPSIFNCLCRHGYFPKQWKVARIIFFVKKNKLVTDPGSYRPVSLLPTIGKVFEKILFHRISYYLNCNKILHNNQFGFREGISTTDCLVKIISDIKDRKKYF